MSTGKPIRVKKEHSNGPDTRDENRDCSGPRNVEYIDHVLSLTINER